MVDGLVVRQAYADAVGEANVAESVGVDEPGHAQDGVAAEADRIEELVVHAAVDHVDAAQSLGGPHVDHTRLHHQVLALHQLHAHLLCQEGVFEIGGVVDAGGEHHDRGLPPAVRGDILEHLAEAEAVVVDRAHPVAVEELREDVLHHPPVFQHIGDAGGAAQVVFEHQELATLVADQVDPRHMDVDVAGYLGVAELGAVAGGAEHQVGGQHPLLEDPLLVVDVMDEQVERMEPLLQAGLDLGPLALADHPRHQVEGPDPLGALLVGVDVEGDPLAEEGGIGGALAAAELVQVHGGELVVERLIMWRADGRGRRTSRRRRARSCSRRRGSRRALPPAFP